MRALSLLQPWASLVIVGAKRWETRSWKAPWSMIGQVIAIHASKSFDDEHRALTLDPPFSAPLKASRIVTLGDVPRGAILGTARLWSCRATNVVRHELTEPELSFGNYEDGRWAWELVDVQKLDTPIPARGSLGLWEVSPNHDAELSR